MTATADLLKVYFEPIEELLRDGAVTNIHVNAWDEVFFDKRGATHRYGGSWRDEEELANAIHTLAASLQQDIDPRRPLLDARLPDGTRINAVLPPVSERPCLSIRVFPETALTGEDLVSFRALRVDMLEFLREQTRKRANILISGCVDSGKTTLLKVLCGEIPPEIRLLVIEDTAELRLSREQHPNMVCLEAASRDSDVDMRTLIVNSLRMSPGAMVLGELREASAAAALRTALNTGLRGVMTTLHANDCADTMIRLTDLVSEATPNTGWEIVAKALRGNIDFVVSCTNTPGRGRYVREIAQFRSERPEPEILYLAE